MKQADMVAIVTGGSRGIGAAIARKLAREGAEVVIVYRNNQQQAEHVVADIIRQGGKAEAYAADVTQEQEVRQLLDEVAQRHGHIDILINNAGVFEGRPLGEVDADHIARVFDGNMGSMLLMTRHALPFFPARGGRIVNLSSNLIYSPRIGTAIYSASKAAVSVLTHAYALELGPRGITVNAVAPAMTETDMTAATPPARREAVANGTPLGRVARPEDIADVVAFLASDDARWITGRTLLTDGGLTAAL
ncbi:SDR family NAD(P)-dependent oxidoreductase [Aquitalea sp. LB_tupeE]|uniref:SDR family NAD(P)-dependent oxidoreductase n=1 Tax=Aquitalea sp. LB_tupeE TaxID=2748078 RepID=UPI0015BE1BA5|nr:3-oxoacyl-ACP reductase family protein [Aquitalea sp. LB_tupeE]NWK79783.1 3-oxoacyl-ACP reductase FabG [Aquitalea sp. LB_tupeE]